MDPGLDQLRGALAGRYEILCEIGRGGMSTVYQAQDLRHDRKVAVKVLEPKLAQSLGAERFLREIKTAANLVHPHILPVHDSGEAGGFLFYVMPYVKGESLRARLTKEKQLPVEEAVLITREIADALSYAHQEGVLHRDVKPGNIMLEAGHAVLADFGVAQAVAEAEDGRLTQTGVLVGTPAYMSPEQAMGGQDIDGRCDQYALGCVLFEMLTGRPPFQVGSVAAVVASQMHRAVPNLRDLRRDVPRPVVETVARALSKSPARRFDSVTAMRKSLDMGQTTGSGARSVLGNRWQWLSRRTRRTIVTGGGALVSALVFFVAWLLINSGGGIEDPSSWVVIPFRGALTTPQEEELLVTLSDELTRQLNQWDSVTAVPQIALSGIWFDRDFQEPTLERIDDGLEVARALGAEGLVALSVAIRRDSLRLSADIFDPETGENRGNTLEAWGLLEDVGSAAAEVAYRILGLEGSASEIADWQGQTTVPGALIEYNAGRRALAQWDLVDAEERLRNATELDPGFALAQHRLALARFWQLEEGLVDASAVGEEIARTSRMALSNSSGLPLRDSLQIDAFHAFQAGDYERARDLYQFLVERDSTDVYAWLLQGSVEYHDHWLTEVSTEGLTPRSNLNVARRSFERAADLTPGFQVAYGTVLKIATLVSQTGGPGFKVPSGEFLAPWKDFENLTQVIPFWPVYLDSLVWVDSSEWEALPDSVVSSGVDRFVEETLEPLRRWAAYESDQARPQQELARAALFLRARRPGPQHWPRADSLTGEALEHASRALALSRDTTRVGLFQLANLRLATGDLSGAREDWTSAREWERNGAAAPVPPLSLNLLVYSGRPLEALECLPGEAPLGRSYPDTVSGDFVTDTTVLPLIQRLQILAAAQVTGPSLEAAFDDLMDRWTVSATRPEREIALLKTVTAPRIAVALSLAPAVLEAWVGKLELQDPLWAALGARGLDRVPLLTEAIGGEHLEIAEPRRSYLLGRIAQDIDEDTLALGLFSRLDSVALGIDSLDPGWGLLALSYLYRGRAYDSLGDRQMAARFYRRFLEAWADPDTGEALTGEASRRLNELSR